MPSVIEVVGSLNVDLVSQTPRVPNAGETIHVTSFSTGFGGKGANQAVACARLLREKAGGYPRDGIQVRMIGAVGSDQFGTDFRGHLEREGIQTEDLITKNDTTTGTATILVEELTGENRILVNYGANGELRTEDVRLQHEDGSHVVFQLEVPLPTVLKGIEVAKKMGKKVIFNPSPAVPLPDEIYRDLFHLIMNETEASMLSGVAEDKLEGQLDHVADIFLDKGVKVVVITLGSKGVFWKGQILAGRQEKGGFLPAHDVKPVDTTAAGDTFVGAYAAYRSLNPEEDVFAAVDFANLAASKSVSKAGAQSSIPFAGELRV